MDASGKVARIHPFQDEHELMEYEEQSSDSGEKLLEQASSQHSMDSD
jgi:hypothetical protein